MQVHLKGNADSCKVGRGGCRRGGGGGGGVAGTPHRGRDETGKGVMYVCCGDMKARPLIGLLLAVAWT